MLVVIYHRSMVNIRTQAIVFDRMFDRFHQHHQHLKFKIMILLIQLIHRGLRVDGQQLVYVYLSFQHENMSY